MILVVGASGYLGRYTAQRLLDAGKRVRACSRDPSKLATLRSTGAEVVAADLIDPHSLDAACSGVEAVFVAAHSLMGSGKYASAAVDDAGHRALIDAAKRAGVARFVYTSAMFAAPDHPIDFMCTKARIEAYLAASGLPFAIVKPSAFMEWHVHEFLGKPLAETGKATIFGPGTNPVNFVAASDVAAVAAEALMSPDAAGSTIDVGGPDNISRNEIAAIYSERLCRPVTLRHVPLRVLRIAASCLRPFQPAIARLLTVSAWSETSDQTYDFAARGERYARPVTHVRDFIAARTRASEGENGRGVRRAA